MKLIYFGVSLFFAVWAQAYPSFIGYGYSSCLTCHFNGAGGGDLNDYGRALWSVEISSRALFPKTTTDDDLGMASGLIGKRELPAWLRPGLKYRSINVMTDPGSPSTTDMPYLMQTDLNLALVLDQNANYVFDATYGYVSTAESRRLGQNSNYIPRQFYFRAQPIESWWIYLGRMDKVFGIRNEDHTSYQRTAIGFNQYSQSDALIVQKVSDKWEATVDIFSGNSQAVSQTNEYKGSSLMTEFELMEKSRIGFSAMSARSTAAFLKAYSVHYRQGLSKGSSLLSEFGTTSTVNQVQSEQAGQYLFIQSNFSLSRGYSLKTIVEKFNANTLTSSPDFWKYQFGILAFPAPRLELRLDLVDLRTVLVNSAKADQWMIEGQVHVSL